jgi:hypothetical protein
MRKIIVAAWWQSSLAVSLRWSMNVKAASAFIYANNATGGTDYVLKAESGQLRCGGYL